MAELPQDRRVVTVDKDSLRLPQGIIDKLHEEFPPAGLNVVGTGQFVVLEHDDDASGVPDGTFIARLPEGFVP